MRQGLVILSLALRGRLNAYCLGARRVPDVHNVTRPKRRHLSTVHLLNIFPLAILGPICPDDRPALSFLDVC